jgi:glucose-6-phosphate 1-dehydrogenase
MDPFALILFGATGDLAKKKIWPALYELHQRGLLPGNGIYVATGRSEWNDESYRDHLRLVLKAHIGDEADTEICDKLLERTIYVRGDLFDPGFYNEIERRLQQMQEAGFAYNNRIFHLAISPHYYQSVIQHIVEQKLDLPGRGWRRILIEKPFGYDLTSAKELDVLLLNHFKEQEIFRIDHYLGKEPVQNILAFRFENGVYEPLLNKDYVDHIQIQMLESEGVEGRGDFYDVTGAMRDVVQNHLLQLMAITMMEAPESMQTDAIRKQRSKVMNQLKPMEIGSLGKTIIRAQYDGYQNIKAVKPNSQTETYVALKAEVDNDRWRGVPIYIRAGKKLNRKVTEISIVFKGVRTPSPNVLNLRISPNEGIVWRFLVKKPGHTTELQEASMQFCYRDILAKQMSSYAKLLLDALQGEQVLFAQSSTIEAQWQFIQPVLDAFTQDGLPLHHYAADTWGPVEADYLIEEDGRAWLEPSLDVCPVY